MLFDSSDVLYGFQHPDPKMMQINLTGFLGGSKARLFIGELWQFLASAQTSPDGMPAELVELKKQELLKRQVEVQLWSYVWPIVRF